MKRPNKDCVRLNIKGVIKRRKMRPDLMEWNHFMLLLNAILFYIIALDNIYMEVI